MTDPRETIRDAARLISRDSRMFVVTGAGMSAESGLPTYRGTGGLYNSGRVEHGMSIEQLLSASTWQRAPELTWKYLGEIGRACAGKQPNRGHRILAAMEAWAGGWSLLTQNIDGLHSAAGSSNVIEIHGTMHRLRCESCGMMRPTGPFETLSIPPSCHECGNVIRPDVVLFDEMLPHSALTRLAAVWKHGFDLVLSIGTTSNFPYIAEPVLFAADEGLPAIEINPSETEVSRHCSHVIRLPASEALQLLWSEVQARENPGTERRS